MLDKVDGEPVEELGMEGMFALQSEVLGSPHESLAEKHLPKVVDGHACGQRVFLGRQPAREAESCAGFAFRPSGESLRDVGAHLVAVLIPDATHKDERVARLLALREDHDVEFTRGGLGFGKLALGAVQGLAGNLVWRMVD